MTFEYMKLISPTLCRDEEATPDGIVAAVSALKGKDDPYVILSQSELTYAQALWTEQGFVLEYQDQNVMNHFESRILLSHPQVITAMQAYLANDENWKSGIEFKKKNIADLPTKLGFSFGSFVGHFMREFREARDKTRDSIGIDPPYC